MQCDDQPERGCPALDSRSADGAPSRTGASLRSQQDEAVPHQPTSALSAVLISQTCQCRRAYCMLAVQLPISSLAAASNAVALCNMKPNNHTACHAGCCKLYQSLES